nr:hypothetical protein CFP56_36295 [Quercus suber]
MASSCSPDVSSWTLAIMRGLGKREHDALSLSRVRISCISSSRAFLSAQQSPLSLSPELAAARTLPPRCCPPEHEQTATGHDSVP